MKSLEFSKLKKVASDDKTTTFRHPYGHEIRIVHGKLSKQMKEKLDNLPMHGKKMAAGGDVDDDDDSGLVKIGSPGNLQVPTPDELQTNMASVAQSQVDQTQNAQDAAPYGTPDTGNTQYGTGVPLDQNNQPNQDASTPQAAQAQAPATAPLPPSSPPTPQPSVPASPQKSAQELAQVGPPAPGSFLTTPTNAQGAYQQLTDETNKLRADFNNGHITPETYHDLFAKKDTLGKIGMIFGMLFSGAGSGLAHQPNLLMEMMNKQIDNDLEAQKQTKSNQFNALNLAETHLRNQSEIALQKSQIDYQKALTANQPIEAQKIRSEIASNQANTAATKLTIAKTSMLLGALQNMSSQVGRIPPGPNQQAATHALGLVSNAANQHMDQLNAQTAQQVEMNWQNHNRTLNALSPEMAKYESDRHVPFVQGSASNEVPQNVRDQLNAQTILDNKGKDLLSYVNQHSGSWNPQTRATAGQKIEEMKNFYNDSIKGGALTQGRLGWYDEQFAKNPTDILPQVMGSTAKLQEMVRSNESRKNQTLKSYGFQTNDAVTSPESTNSNTKETTSQSKSGKPIVLRNGKWVYL